MKGEAGKRFRRGAATRGRGGEYHSQGKNRQTPMEKKVELGDEIRERGEKSRMRNKPLCRHGHVRVSWKGRTRDVELAGKESLHRGLGSYGGVHGTRSPCSGDTTTRWVRRRDVLEKLVEMGSSKRMKAKKGGTRVASPTKSCLGSSRNAPGGTWERAEVTNNLNFQAQGPPIRGGWGLSSTKGTPKREDN